MAIMLASDFTIQNPVQNPQSYTTRNALYAAMPGYWASAKWKGDGNSYIIYVFGGDNSAFVDAPCPLFCEEEIFKLVFDSPLKIQIIKK